MHQRSLLQIAFAAVGVTYFSGARDHAAKRDCRPRDCDHDEDLVALIWFGSDDGQNGDGGA